MLGYVLQSLTILFTIFGLTLSAISCSQPPREEVFSPEPGVRIESEADASISILQSMPEMSLPLQNAAEMYRETLEKPPSINIQTVAGEDYSSALRMGLLSGSRIDLFHLLSGDAAPLAEHLENMGALAPWVGEAVGGLAEAVTVDGVIRGAPFSLEGVGLIVNRGIFATAGISLDEVDGYEELAKALTDLREQITDGVLSESYPQLEAVSDIAAGDAEYLSEVLAELLLYGAFASPAAAEAAVTLELPVADAAESAVSLLARMSPYRGGWAGLAGVGRARILENGLAAERVAVILESTGACRRILAANPALEGKLTFLPVYFEDAERGAAFAGAPCWWAVNAGSASESKSAAGDLLHWLYRTPEGGGVLADEFGALSPYGDMPAHSGLSPYGGLLAAFARGEAVPQLAPSAPGGWCEEVFAKEIGEYFTVYNREWRETTAACREGWQRLREGRQPEG